MNLKEFFKPTVGKIILGIILFLLLPVPWSVTILGGPAECGGLRTCVLGHGYSWWPLGGLFFVFSLFYTNQAFQATIDYLWKLPYLLISSYLISCLIIYLYKRIIRKAR